MRETRRILRRMMSSTSSGVRCGREGDGAGVVGDAIGCCSDAAVLGCYLSPRESRVPVSRGVAGWGLGVV